MITIPLLTGLMLVLKLENTWIGRASLFTLFLAIFLASVYSLPA